MVIDPSDLSLRSSNLVLTGTVRNCSGGPSPWGWLSCEESVVKSGDMGPYTKRHGYVFRCPIDADSLRPPEAIPAYGRFNHEAVAIEPRTHIAYLTEDREDGCLYRFVPDDPSKPFVGELQALRIPERPAFFTTTWREVGLSRGSKLAIDWVPLTNTDPDDDSLRYRALEKGAATFSRGEGLWYADGELYFAATSGGKHQSGQIFRVILPRPPSKARPWSSWSKPTATASLTPTS